MLFPKSLSLGGVLLGLAVSGNAQPALNTFTNAIYVDASAKIGGDGSQLKPFSTIGAALQLAKPGDGVIVRAGVYRENLRLPTGAPGQPLTLMAAPGEHVVVSGFAPVGGWKPWRAQIQVAEVNFAPNGLFVRQKLQPMAQSPNEGWWDAADISHGADFTVNDPAHLKSVPADLSGAHAMFLQQSGSIIVSGPLVASDKNAGSIEVAAGRLQLGSGDKYQLKNHPDLIDRPGEWAFQKSGDAYKIYFWPVNSEDLAQTQTRRGKTNLIQGNGISNVNVDGLEIGGAGGYGLSIGGGSSDVSVTDCVISGNGDFGLMMRGVVNAEIARNIVVNNASGIGVLSARNVNVEENEVAFNEVDGIIVAGDVSGRYGKPGANPADETRDVTLRRNYVHHHMLSAHPDNIQMYRGVHDVKLIENLTLGGGQSLMTEETDGGELTGNVFLSSDANMILFGHGNSHNWTLKNNTLALPGYNIISFTGHNYNATNNIFYGPLTNIVATYQGDHNLFSQMPRGAKFESYPTFAAVARATGQEEHSVLNAAPLRNVPISQGVGEVLTLATRDSMLLRDAATFKVGDTVEINWDGIARKLTQVAPEQAQYLGKARAYTRVTFAPELPALPLRFVVVDNWGQSDNINLDARLKPEIAGNYGASLDVAAFMRGDFDGDGQRDLPNLSDDVKQALPDPNALLSPMF